jgi:hypothetical protein
MLHQDDVNVTRISHYWECMTFQRRREKEKKNTLIKNKFKKNSVLSLNRTKVIHT